MPAHLPAVDVERLAADARAAGRLGIDTEFMTEGRYYALLCLVQVAVPDASAPDGVRVELLDPLDPSLDPAPLARVLADPAVQTVLHAARQDVALLRRVWETEVTSVFDTQVAAGFAGFGAQVGYTNLLGDALGVRLPGSAGFTRWDVRPLTSEQVEYAAGDVRYLLALADRLDERLQRSGRADWVRDECRALEASTDRRDPDEAWRRLPKVNQLSGPARAVAKELAAWRERTAAAEDRPIASVVSDAALVEVARRQPVDESSLAKIRGLHGGVLRRRGRDLVAAVQRGREAAPIGRDGNGGLGLTAADAPVIALAEALLRQRALDAGVAYEVLAKRSDLDRVVAATRRGEAEPDVRVLHGWRRELAGDELLRLLAGGRALRVDAAGRLQVGMEATSAG
jgi:ribonuclease D